MDIIDISKLETIIYKLTHKIRLTEKENERVESIVYGTSKKVELINY